MRATFAFAGVEGHASATRPMLFPILGAHVSGAEFIYPDKSWKETSGMLANFVADSGAGKGLLDGTTLCNQVKRDYPELMTESDVADDVLATFIQHEPSTIPICADRANALLGNSQTLP